MRFCIPTRFRSAAWWPLKDPSLCHWCPQRPQTVCGLEGYSVYPVVQLWKRVRNQLLEYGVISCDPASLRSRKEICVSWVLIRVSTRRISLWVSYADSWWFVYVVDILPMESVCIPILKCKIAVFTYTAESHIYILKHQQHDMLSLLGDDYATIKMSLIALDCSYIPRPLPLH